MPSYTQAQLDRKYHETLLEIKGLDNLIAAFQKKANDAKHRGDAKSEKAYEDEIKKANRELHSAKVTKASLAQEYLRRNQHPPSH